MKVYIVYQSVGNDNSVASYYPSVFRKYKSAIEHLKQLADDICNIYTARVTAIFLPDEKSFDGKYTYPFIELEDADGAKIEFNLLEETI